MSYCCLSQNTLISMCRGTSMIRKYALCFHMLSFSFSLLVTYVYISSPNFAIFYFISPHAFSSFLLLGTSRMALCVISTFAGYYEREISAHTYIFILGEKCSQNSQNVLAFSRAAFYHTCISVKNVLLAIRITLYYIDYLIFIYYWYYTLKELTFALMSLH